MLDFLYKQKNIEQGTVANSCCRYSWKAPVFNIPNLRDGLKTEVVS